MAIDTDTITPEIDAPAPPEDSFDDRDDSPAPESITDSPSDADDSEPPEPEPDEPSLPAWVSDDLIDVATSYGLDPSELSSYKSAQDFQKACRIADRQYARQQAPAQSPPPPPPVQRQVPPPVAPDDLTIDLDHYREANYDDDTLRVVKVAKALQEQVQAMQYERTEEVRHNHLNAFHSVLDGMDKKLFGGNAALTQELDQRRAAVWNAYVGLVSTNEQLAQARTRPQQERIMSALARRAALATFGDELIAQNGKARSAALTEQARRRRPAATRGRERSELPPTQSTPQSLHQEAMRVANKMAPLYDKLIEDSGNAPE